MLRADLFKSCSYPPIADAALRSIGSDFRAKVEDAAQSFGQDPADYTVHLLDRFAGNAQPDDWSELDDAMSGCDMPVLSGLQFVVETMISKQSCGQSAFEPCAG